MLISHLRHMVMCSIKILSQYELQVSVIVADSATENNSFFEGMSSKSIDSYIPNDLKNALKYISIIISKI